MALKPEGFKNSKIQNNVPDLQHQVKTYNIVIFKVVSVIMEIKTKGMTMANFTNYQKRQLVDFLKKYPCIIYVTNCLEYKH